MKVTFFWNYLNHHQVFIAEAIYNLLGDNFRFVSTLARDEKELKGGMDYSNRPYCILAAESEEAHRQAVLYAESSDVCVFGACSQEYAVIRAKRNPHSLSFECGERWLKRGFLNILSPVLCKCWFNYIHHYRKANFYKLCSSAFTAHDDELLGCYKGRHFKWGYFTEVSSGFMDEHRFQKFFSHPIRLMWCARFISWKHPELPIECAKYLKADGYEFELHLYGDGPMRERMELKVKNYNLRDNVFFHGNVPNKEIQQAMQKSEIFLFTSDRREGWGAVANEAMAAGSCLIASDQIGAAPYLIRDGINGFMFHDRDVLSLFKIVKHVMDNPTECNCLRRQAYTDMVNIWGPKHAAESLLQLIDVLQKGKDSSITEGPCSKAE